MDFSQRSVLFWLNGRWWIYKNCQKLNNFMAAIMRLKWPLLTLGEQFETIYSDGENVNATL